MDAELTGERCRDAADDLWRRTLAQIPTCIGRLVYLASLRDSHSGLYEHHGLAQVFGELVAREALDASHRDVFRRWLGFDLRAQRADLEEYFAGHENAAPTILSTWISLKSYRNFLPATAAEGERMLFLAEMEVLIEQLSRECGVAVPDPDA